MLRPPGNGRLDVAFAQVGVDPLDHLVQVGVPRRGPLGDQPNDLVVPLRVEGREREILQLPLDRIHAEPVGERRHHLQRLPGLPLLLGGRQEPERAHVVQPVRQLDDQYPRIAGHRHDHLPDRLGLGRLAELDLVQLGYAVDEVRHLGAELGRHLLNRETGVFDRVVQQRSHQRDGVHAQLGEDRGHCQRVGDVRVAALASLPAMPFFGQVVAALEEPGVDLGMRAAVNGEQGLEDRADRRRSLRSGNNAPGQAVPDPASMLLAGAGHSGCLGGGEHRRWRGRAPFRGVVNGRRAVPAHAGARNGGLRRDRHLRLQGFGGQRDPPCETNAAKSSPPVIPSGVHARRDEAVDYAH